MTGLHAVAALVTGVLLAGAERAVFALVGLLARLLSRVAPPRLAVPQLEAPPARPEAVAPMPAVLLLLLRRVHHRRGPPVVL